MKTSVGVLGFGKMGSAFARKLAQPESSFTVSATSHSSESAARYFAATGIPCSSDNLQLAKKSQIIILAVKPYQAADVLAQIKDVLHEGQCLISLCAGISLAQLEAWVDAKISIVRAMPNLPVAVGAGVTVFAASPKLTLAQRERAEVIFRSLGDAIEIDESRMDAATGLSGCSPAFVFMMIDALSEAGASLGLPAALALRMANQTVLGAAKMLVETGRLPIELKNEVTTPGGCTIEGVNVLELAKFSQSLGAAVTAAARKSAHLQAKIVASK